METRQHIRVSAAAGLLAWGLVSSASFAQQPAAPPWPSAEQPAYPASPYRGVTDGFGRTIPCRCRFQGQEYPLGDLVCMTTPVGVVMTRCDLMQNNTSWVPTATPCTLSRAREGGRLALGP